MGRFSIPLRYKGLIEYLKLKYELNIEDHPYQPSMIDVEFSGIIEITLDDLKQVHKAGIDIMGSGSVDFLKYEFAIIQQSIAESLKNARLLEYKLYEKIVLEDTEKTIVLSIRITPHEKKMLEEKAKKENMSISEYVRSVLFSSI